MIFLWFLLQTKCGNDFLVVLMIFMILNFLLFRFHIIVIGIILAIPLRHLYYICSAYV